MTIPVEQIQLDDEAALAAALAFDSAHGSGRMPDVATHARYVRVERDQIVVVARDEATRELIGYGRGALIDMDDGERVQTELTSHPASPDVARTLADAISNWGAARGATSLLVHSTNLTPERERVLDAIGAERIGERQSVLRTLIDADSERTPPAMPGIRIVSLAAEPTLARGTYAVWADAAVRIPGNPTTHRPRWEEFLREIREGIDTEWPEHLLVAIDDAYDAIGFAFITPRNPDGSIWSHRFTAVRHDHLGRGIGRLLKEHMIVAASRAGIPALRASNDLPNVAMRRINDALGYELVSTTTMHELAPDM